MFPRISTPLLGLVLASTAAGLGGCAPARAPELAGDPPELRLETVKFRLYRGETIRADGTAATVAFRRDSTEVHATDLAVRLRDKAEPVILTAPIGQGVVQTRKLEASGGLKAVRRADVVTTESARFVPGDGPKAAGQVIGESPVKIEGRGYQFLGTGFTLDPAAGRVALLGQPRLVAGLPASGARGTR